MKPTLFIVAPVANHDAFSTDNRYFSLSASDHKWIQILFGADLLKKIRVRTIMGIKFCFVLDEYFFYGFLFFVIGLVYSLTDRERIQ